MNKTVFEDKHLEQSEFEELEERLEMNFWSYFFGFSGSFWGYSFSGGSQ